MRLALWQGHSPAGDISAAMAALETALNAAGAAGATTLVTPEIYLPGYNHPAIADHAQPRGGAWHGTVAAFCRKAGCGIVLGYAERDGATVCNSALVLDDRGAQVAHYRKIQLYGPREKALYTQGDAYVTFDMNGTKAAILICYDIEFAPHVAALAAQGVRIILVPTANMQPYTHVVRHTVPAMAANHAVSIVYANYCGSEGDLDYVGGSLIAAADGSIPAQAGTTPALLIADLPEGYPEQHLSTQALDLRTIPL
ncbi:nitrilase [Fertoebacter nigrum]|uniref:Nitrilase n=1 Tax=Fertoeibacter niger TaxID=2656921 RepID=A0A8X8KNS0_9RHOB|nr:nitrilase-related carbon-nitrogen hydrolase [Fertoeibacter niger]NUB45305.1 nitrilase [Fertoeibacter niger]